MKSHLSFVTGFTCDSKLAVFGSNIYHCYKLTFFKSRYIYKKHIDMPLQHNQHYYTKVEVTEILNISLAKINRALASKELGYIKVGKRSVRIPEQDLQQWIKRNEEILPSIS